MGIEKLLNLQLEMFTMMLIGVVLIKAKVLNQIFCMMLGKGLYGRLEESESKILRYSTVCSNAGFLGSPIAENVFGSMGLAYASIFLIPQRIVMWSAGLSYFTVASSKKEVLKKVITHPCIVAVAIGVLFMILQVRLPLFLNNTLSKLSAVSTPMSMIVIGTILAEIDLKEFTNKKICSFTVIRLVGIPLICYIYCKLFHIDELITGVCVLLSAMPAGATTALLASKYGGNEKFATKMVVFQL